MAETKRVRRTAEQIAADLDEQVKKLEQSISEVENKKRLMMAEYDRKIESIRAKIKALEDKKAKVLSPKKTARKPRRSKKQKLEAILKQASKSGLKPEEIAAKLGIDVVE